MFVGLKYRLNMIVYSIICGGSTSNIVVALGPGHASLLDGDLIMSCMTLETSHDPPTGRLLATMHDFFIEQL